MGSLFEVDGVTGQVKFRQKQSHQFVQENGTVDASSPVTGQTFYRTDIPALEVWNGSAWQLMLSSGSNLGSGEGIFSATSGSTIQLKSIVAGSGLSHTSNSSTVTLSISISGDVIVTAGVAAIQPNVIFNSMVNSAAAIATSKLADSVNFLLSNTTHALSAGVRYTLPGGEIFSNPGDLITKDYADALAAGVTWKTAVQAATAGAALPAVTYSNGSAGVGATLTEVGFGALSIDGYSPILDDRILIKDQVSPIQNGIYIVTVVGDPGTQFILTRTSDYDTAAEVGAGTAAFVTNGTLNANQGWMQTTNGTIVIGTSNLVFTQFTGVGDITAGTGLSKSGNTLNVLKDNSTIDFNGSNQLEVKSGGITNTQVNSAAAIAYTKLSLTLSIVNGDISSSAAIAYNKLNLATSILNTDISATAAIDITKLAHGTADQVFSTNHAGTGNEFKTITGTANQITVTGAIGTITLATPQDLATTSTPQFASMGLGVAAASVLDVSGSVGFAITSYATSHTLDATNYTALVDASGAGRTITLPTAVGITRRVYTIKKTDSSANAVTIATTSSQTIDGVTTQVLNAQYETYTVQSDGSNWWII